MRHRREAKTTRRPRVITWRLVIVSLVVGVVLAVGSVPFAAVAWQSAKNVKQGPDLAACFQREGHGVLVTRYDYVGATTWGSLSAPGVDDATLNYFAGRGSHVGGLRSQAAWALYAS